MQRSSRGASLAEAVSALAIFVPIVFLVIYVVIQATVSYTVHAALTQTSLTCAHDLGVVWVSQNQPNQPLTREQQDLVYNAVPVHGMKVEYSDAVFDFNSSPATITVSATSPGGNFLPAGVFDYFPGVSRLPIKASCIYPLPSRRSGE